MQGLRKQEANKFEAFFEIVQQEASKRSCIFFLDCGQGDMYEDEKFICEDLCGWLIPEAMAEEFTPLFMKNSDKQHDFDDFYVYIDYKVDNGDIEIEIDEGTDDFIVELDLKSEIVKK